MGLFPQTLRFPMSLLLWTSGVFSAFVRHSVIFLWESVQEARHLPSSCAPYATKPSTQLPATPDPSKATEKRRHTAMKNTPHQDTVAIVWLLL